MNLGLKILQCQRCRELAKVMPTRTCQLLLWATSQAIVFPIISFAFKEKKRGRPNKTPDPHGGQTKKFAVSY